MKQSKEFNHRIFTKLSCRVEGPIINKLKCLRRVTKINSNSQRKMLSDRFVVKESMVSWIRNHQIFIPIKSIKKDYFK